MAGGRNANFFPSAVRSLTRFTWAEFEDRARQARKEHIFAFPPNKMNCSKSKLKRLQATEAWPAIKQNLFLDDISTLEADIHQCCWEGYFRLSKWTDLGTVLHQAGHLFCVFLALLQEAKGMRESIWGSGLSRAGLREKTLSSGAQQHPTTLTGPSPSMNCLLQ